MVSSIPDVPFEGSSLEVPVQLNNPPDQQLDVLLNFDSLYSQVRLDT